MDDQFTDVGSAAALLCLFTAVTVLNQGLRERSAPIWVPIAGLLALAALIFERQWYVHLCYTTWPSFG
jgi:hypothetical protein